VRQPSNAPRKRAGLVERGWLFWTVAVGCWAAGIALALAGSYWWGVGLVLFASDGPSIFDIFG
jgi:hypothetical protein